MPGDVHWTVEVYRTIALDLSTGVPHLLKAGPQSSANTGVTVHDVTHDGSGDVFVAMPPVPFGYEGRDVVARYCASLFAAGRRFDLVPARANGQPAFGAYLRSPAGIRHATAFYVLTLAGGQICAITRFEASVLPWFGLPRSLPNR